MTYSKNKWMPRSQLAAMWHIRDKTGLFDYIGLDHLRQSAKVLHEFLSRQQLEPLTLGLTQTDDFSEEEVAAFAMFGVRRILFQMRRRLASGHQIMKGAAEVWLESRLWVLPADPEFPECLQLFTAHIAEDLQLTEPRIRSWPLISNGKPTTATLDAIDLTHQLPKAFVSKTSVPSHHQVISELPMEFGQTGSEDHGEDSQSCLTQVQNPKSVQTPMVLVNTEDSRDFANSGDQNLGISLSPSAKNTPIPAAGAGAGADKPATFSQYDQSLERSNLSSSTTSCQTKKVQLNHDLIAVQRQSGMTIMECWTQYRSVPSGESAYGKALFYKLVNDQNNKHRSPKLASVRGQSPPIP